MNRDITFSIILFIVVVILIITTYMNAGTGAKVPIMAVTQNAITIITLWAASRLLFLKNKSDLTVSFGLFFLGMVFFTGFMTIPHTYLLPWFENRAAFGGAMHWGYVIGHAFFYLGIAAFVRVPLQWTFPKLKNVGTIFFLVLGAITTAVNIARPSFPEFDPLTGFTALNVDPLVAQLVAINAGLAWLPAGIYFIIKGLKSHEKIVKSRAVLIGLGLLITIIGGPLHDFAKTNFQFFAADFLGIFGLFILSLGVLYKLETSQRIEPEARG